MEPSGPVLTRLRVTPTRAASVELRSSDSMDDVNLFTTRKRPRLDSGERTYRSMSADPTRSPPVEDGPVSVLSKDPDGQDSSEVPDPSNALAPISTTPSKMTINLREPGDPKSPTQFSKTASASLTMRGGMVETTGSQSLEQEHSNKNASSSSPRVVLIASSPPNSPEIEVAEIEDMTDDPGETRWKPLTSSKSPMHITEVRDLEIALLDRFPHASSGRDLRKTVTLIAGALEKNEFGDGNILRELGSWIETNLHATESYASQWWEMVQDDREFWDEMPALVEALARRSVNRSGFSKVLQSETDMTLNTENPLQSFLVAYTSLSLRMARIDLATLTEHFQESVAHPDLISERHLQAFYTITNRGCPFWKGLLDGAENDFKAISTAMMDRFVNPPESGVALIVRISQEILVQSPVDSSFFQKILGQIQIMVRLMYQYRVLQHDATESGRPLTSAFDILPSQAYQFFQIVDERFQHFISKQVTALTIDVSQLLVSQLSLLLRQIASSIERFAQDFMDKHSIQARIPSKEESVLLVEMAWKLNMLKRCILEGRMEIRVQGVETMQIELVNVYTKHVQHSPASKDLAIVQYISSFMLTNKLVDYLVGVDSHPQLIGRCGNIIGFLVVTHTYTETESDTIWNAITNSQDPRFIDTLLAMLTSIFNIASYPVLLYLTTKLNELAVQAFDISMVRYSRNLLENLRRTWKFESDNSKMDMPPFHLCIRLIRQTSMDNSLEITRRREIHQFAAIELGLCLPLGPSVSDRKAIYEECIRDISERTLSATGSIYALDAMLSQHYEKELMSLTREWDVAQLVVDEFAHTIEAERATSSSPQMLDERLNIRLGLIHNLILYVPDNIAASVGNRLWEYAVGLHALNHTSRELAWMSFLRIIRRVVSRNSYIDRCVREYLPKLQARLYTEGCLHFVQDVNNYHYRIAFARPDNIVKLEPTAGDLLWQMSLTALPGTVESKAVSMLVTLYLDSPDNARRSRSEIEAIHIGVVERCVRQLASAASKLKAFYDATSNGEDEAMVVVAPEEEVYTYKLSFSRSLTILKELIRGVRSRPRYSPLVRIQPHIPIVHRDAAGTSLQIRYQLFGRGATNDIRTIEVGCTETLREFVSRLKTLTSFAKLTMISGGQKLDLNKIMDQTVQDLRLDEKGLLLVKQDMESESKPDSVQSSGLRPVEIEIMTHSSELYELLAMEESLAKEVFEFLVMFPPHDSLATLLCSRETPSETIFPLGAPFKTLYSVYTLRQCLAYQKPNSPARQELISHGIRSSIAFLESMNLFTRPQGIEMNITMAAHLVECLANLLRDYTTSSVAEPITTRPDVLSDRLRSLIHDGLEAEGSLEADLMVSACFAVLLRISLHSKAFWEMFKGADLCSTYLRRLLLEEPKWKLRRLVADNIKGTCIDSERVSTDLAVDFIRYMWICIADVIPYCPDNGDACQELFEVASMLFQRIDHAYRLKLDLVPYVQSWSEILVKHKHTEFVGRDNIDWLVFGLSNLLLSVFQDARSFGKSLPIPDGFVATLFHAHLFPEMPKPTEGQPIEALVPNLHSNTRQELYSIILVLSNDISNYQALLMLVRNLLSHGEESNAFSWGIAQIMEDFHYDMNWSVERDKSIRSPTGYPGLRNLSNTCYMNSLFTQLFMNVRFRDFILGINVTEPLGSQRLLHETQSLFGYMQDTMLRSVDSQGIVESLVTYENTLIDITVQMDVDEFYNLLFDRWEAQIIPAGDKTQFRGFYGGQMVQQIKSKECPHISERLEQFSAIQCDIQGNATLLDSLNAFVSGETMEGDNKYSCTSCGCYVDAVKRACFKDVPDNLIFHLKRFDYDVMTGMRSKINEAFEFPHQIDMGPYHVDYRKDHDLPSMPDMFELVGVLVHSGTAESGHYYSYIKERPASPTTGGGWVEFNDVDVTRFDPNNIADQCFGGYSETAPYPTRFLKNWNAYMLFYERMRPKKTYNEDQAINLSASPAKCTIPTDIADRVASNNSEWLRYYCLFDPTHASFARQLLEQLRGVNNGECSDDHSIEKEAIWLSLDYLERILSRAKDSSNFTKSLNSLTKMIGSCAVCCQLALEWVVTSEVALRNLLLRCPNAKVRKDFATMIVVALQHLRQNKPNYYGFQDPDEADAQSSGKELRPGGTFPLIVARIADLWGCLYGHARAWDDYFSLLADLASIGLHETHVILNRHLLQGCFEILVVDHAKASRIRSENAHYASYTRLLEKGRRFSLVKLVEVVAILLEKIDLTITPVRRSQDRRLDPNKMPLVRVEDELMQLGSDNTRSKNLCVFLEKILSNNINVPATRRIVKVMTLAEPQFGMLELTQKTISSGINIEPANLAAPYLEAAMAFCEATPSEESAQNMIKYIAGEVETIGDYGGREHLEFFTRTRRLMSLRDNFEQGFFNRIVLRTVPQWAPALLHYREDHVRLSTLDLLRHLVFNHDVNNMDDEEHAELIETAAKDLQIACTRRCNSLVQEQKPVDRHTVEQISQVIMYCLKHYYTEANDTRSISEAEGVLAALDVLTVSDVDEGASDTWINASDDIPTDSDSEFLTTSP